MKHPKAILIFVIMVLRLAGDNQISPKINQSIIDQISPVLDSLKMIDTSVRLK